MAFKRRKENKKHYSEFFQTLNKVEQRAWKKLLPKILQSPLVKKSQIDINICYIIADFSVGTLIPCILCKEIVCFFNLNRREPVRCSNTNCATLLLNRWCDNCGNYTISSKHDNANYKLKCIGCRKIVCPFNCVKPCVNKCNNHQESICLECAQIVVFFDGYNCGLCDECGKLLCGECYCRSATCRSCHYYN